MGIFTAYNIKSHLLTTLFRISPSESNKNKKELKERKIAENLLINSTLTKSQKKERIEQKMFKYLTQDLKVI